MEKEIEESKQNVSLLEKKIAELEDEKQRIREVSEGNLSKIKGKYEGDIDELKETIKKLEATSENLDK